MTILFGCYHRKFLAGSGWKCNILIWNQLYLNEEGLYYTCPSKSHFSHFLTFFPIFAYSPISLSVTDNMVPLYMDAHMIQTLLSHIKDFEKECKMIQNSVRAMTTLSIHNPYLFVQIKFLWSSFVLKFGD